MSSDSLGLSSTMNCQFSCNQISEKVPYTTVEFLIVILINCCFYSNSFFMGSCTVYQMLHIKKVYNFSYGEVLFNKTFIYISFMEGVPGVYLQK